MKTFKALFVSTLFCILFLSACNGKKSESKERDNADNQFLNKAFPEKSMPFSFDPTGVFDNSPLSKEEMDTYFPNLVASNDPYSVYPIARLQLFENSTSVIYAQDMIDADFYIKTISEGELSFTKSVALPIHIQYEDGRYCMPTFYANGKLKVERRVEGSDKVEISEYQLTKDNKLE